MNLLQILRVADWESRAKIVFIFAIPFLFLGFAGGDLGIWLFSFGFSWFVTRYLVG